MVIPMTLMPTSYIFLTPVLFIPWILFIVFAFQYINGLKRMKCECAIKDKTGDNALLTMSIIQIVSFALSFISMMTVVYVFATKIINMDF
jgi:hypothetical protein